MTAKSSAKLPAKASTKTKSKAEAPSSKVTVKRFPISEQREEGKVHILIYDSSRDDLEKLGDLEEALARVYFDSVKYEMVSLDKSVTPAGTFVAALIYKELSDDCLPLLEDDEITIGLDQDG